MIKRRIIAAMLICALFSLGGCGLKAPPAPPAPLTEYDDNSDVDKKGVDITDDTAKRMYDLYGDIPSKAEDTPEPSITVDELSEVPEEFKYLYDTGSDDKKDEGQKKEKDNTNTNDESKSD